MECTHNQLHFDSAGLRTSRLSLERAYSGYWTAVDCTISHCHWTGHTQGILGAADKSLAALAAALPEAKHVEEVGVPRGRQRMKEEKKITEPRKAACNRGRCITLQEARSAQQTRLLDEQGTGPEHRDAVEWPMLLSLLAKGVGFLWADSYNENASAATKCLQFANQAEVPEHKMLSMEKTA
eukprot:1161795-Pelagomonas_calceolata.AAC.11